MVHKPKHKVHSFRGLLGDGGQDEINLERSNANLAYRIIKLEIIANRPGDANAESSVKVFTDEQTSITSTIDFSDTSLLAAATMGSSDQSYYYGSSPVIIFDNTLFSRNIYVTHVESHGSESCNYYIEIEEVPVTASTLMQIKLGTARRLIGAKMGA